MKDNTDTQHARAPGRHYVLEDFLEEVSPKATEVGSCWPGRSERKLLSIDCRGHVFRGILGPEHLLLLPIGETQS